MNENVFNKVGSLTVLRNKLNNYGIHRFETLKEISDFKINYQAEIAECIRLETSNLNSEIEDLKQELSCKVEEYNNQIELRKLELFQQIKNNEEFINKKNKYKLFYPASMLFKRLRIKQNKKLTQDFENVLKKPLKGKINNIQKLEKRIEFCTINFKEIIDRRTAEEISNIEYTLNTLNELDSIYKGAIGELKAEKQLSKLPKHFFIINDFQQHFDSPIYDKRNDERIHSIQIDHIVVGPTGLFVIETKNWNQDSLQNHDLYSPIKQLKRSSFALFVYLNGLVTENKLKTFKIPWGNKKVSCNSILLMTNVTTQERFQYVKVTTLDSINGYIMNQSREFEESQVSELVTLLTK